MKHRIKLPISFYLFKYSAYLLIFACIFTFGYLTDKFVASIFLFIAYLSLRYLFPKTWHSKSFLRCIFWSIASFFVAIELTPELSISILSSIVIGIIFDAILHRIGDYTDLLKEKAKDACEMIYEMDEPELRMYAKMKGLKEVMIDTLVLRVIHNYKWVEIQQERAYSKTAIRYHKQVIEKALKIKL